MMQQWFKDAKFGVFMHWGIYSVLGIPESWSFYNGEISYEDYMGQAKGFTAANYDPAKWAELFTKIGARYTILTSKHHDGVALWDTSESSLNVVKKTPAGKDLIAPYCEAMRKAGLKVGLYFSHLDWSHPDNPSVNRDDIIPDENDAGFKRFTSNPNGNDYDRWGNFLKFHRAQIKELMTNFGTIDLIWFDGDWEKNREQWDMKGLRDFLHSMNPNVIINSRMQGYGDYPTPEQGFPVLDPEGDAWEFCMTLNNSWGYQKGDDNHKPVDRLVRIFCEIIGRGGNLLLGIGPLEDGTFQPEQVKRLLALGEWLEPVKEAVYETTKGLSCRCYNMPSTLSKDRKSLYLYAFDKPKELFVKGLKNKIVKATILKSGTELIVEKMLGADWAGVPPTVWIKMPANELDEYATVIKLELDRELDIYWGESGAIEAN